MRPRSRETPPKLAFLDPRDQAQPDGPIRRRHLVTKLVDELDIDVAAALAIVQGIEHAVEETVAANQSVLLPLAGEYPKPRIRSVAPNAPARRDPIAVMSLASLIATKSQRSVAEVEATLTMIAETLDEAPASIAAYVPGAGYVGGARAIAEVERENYVLDLQRFRHLRTATWVLQCNPKLFDVFAQRGVFGVPEDWAINRYKDRVEHGDRVVFWVSGPDAGVYALGEVVGEPFEGDVDDLFVLDDDHPHWDTFLPIELYIDLFEQPIKRTELKRNPTFASDPIMSMPWSANPHPMSSEALEILLDRLPTDRPTRR